MASLEKQVIDLTHALDEVDQYERRDTIILSGPDLPAERDDESPSDVVMSTMNNILGLKLAQGDLNVDHRLGRRRVRPE